MPTFSEICNRTRPVYERKGPDGAVVSRHRLKADADLSLADREVVAAVSQGYFRADADVLAAILYDPLPAPTADEIPAAFALWVNSMTEAEGEEDGNQETQEGDVGEVLAAVQYWYGNPGQPWDTVPQWRISAYLEQLPRVKAQETLQLITANSLSGPHQSKKAARQARRGIKRLERLANGGRRAPKRKPTFEEHQLMLASLGIVYEVSK